MSVFGTIMSKIFGQREGSATPAVSQALAGSTPGQASTASSSAAASTPASGANAQTAAPSALGPTQSTVDVEAILDKLASERGEKLNWRQSIVDLMKLLSLDSSLANRKQLAQELHYTGDTNDSASMNIWLHKQVMRKLAENGGKVPQDLMH